MTLRKLFLIVFSYLSLTIPQYNKAMELTFAAKQIIMVSTTLLFGLAHQALITKKSKNKETQKNKKQKKENNSLPTISIKSKNTLYNITNNILINAPQTIIQQEVSKNIPDKVLCDASTQTDSIKSAYEIEYDRQEFSDDEWALLEAAENSDLELVQYYAKKGTNMSIADNDGNTLLHIAILHDDTPLINWLLSNRELNYLMRARNNQGLTPIDCLTQKTNKTLANLEI